MNGATIMPALAPPTTTGNNEVEPYATVSFIVSGLSDDLLHRFMGAVAELKADPNVTTVVSRRQQQQQGRVVPASSPLPPAAAKGYLHDVRSIEEVSFGLVSDHGPFGAWGRAFPVLLIKQEQRENEKEEERMTAVAPVEAGDMAAAPQAAKYIGRAALPVRLLQAYACEPDADRNSNSDNGNTNDASDVNGGKKRKQKKQPLTCRLVIVKKDLITNPPPAVAACPGACIIAVDHAHSYPTPVVSLRPMPPPPLQGGEKEKKKREREGWEGQAAVELSAAAGIAGPGKLAGLMRAQGVWEAVVDVSRHWTSDHPHNNGSEAVEKTTMRKERESLPAVLFSPIETELPFLRTLSRESPAAAKSRAIYETTATTATGYYGEQQQQQQQRGPMLSLTFLGNDPKKAFDRGEWLRSLPAELQDTIAEDDERRRHAGVEMRRKRRQQQAAKANININSSSSSSTVDTDQEEEEEESVLRTVAFEVTRVRPVNMRGSCWCETVLPTPAPLKKYIDEVKKTRQQQQPPKQAASSATGAVVSGASSPTTATAAATVSSPTATGPHAPHRSSSSSNRSRAAARPATTASSMTSLYGSDDDDDGGEGERSDAVRGWCVRPLCRARPVASPGLVASRTQQVWNCMADLSCLEDHALEIEVEVPACLLPPPSLRPLKTAAAAADNNSSGSGGDCLYPAERDFSGGGGGVYSPHSTKTVRGTTVLISSMFNQGTKGVVQAAIPCRIPNPHASNGKGGRTTQVWVFLHVQYLFIFPYNNDSSDLRVVRSAESFDRLTVRTLIGHRGLGKTYTRRDGRLGAPLRLGTSKLAENSIESLNAAHRRGCEMVEFDVMLTLDRIPIIFHDPILVLHAMEKDKESDDAAVLDGVGCNDDAANGNGNGGGGVPVTLAPQSLSINGSFSSDFDGTALTGLQRWYLQKMGSFVPIPVATHTLTRRQLDALVTESFSFGGGTEPPRLKTMVIRHWLQILRVYRNRSRLQCLRDHSMRVSVADADEFRGCARLATTTTAQPPPSKASGGGGGGDGNDPPPQHHYQEQLVMANTNLGDTACAAVASSSQHQVCGAQDPVSGLLPMFDMYKRQLRRANRMLERQEDITNRIPALHELFQRTPPSLRLDIEVKYPFMPRWDASLFQQSDAFEVNGFIDAILEVVFAYADDGREIAFSSFEPDICVALAAKQSRYDVIFLCDTEERSDLKDYRSFFIEGAMQFARLHNLSGISVNATTLPLIRRCGGDGDGDRDDNNGESNTSTTVCAAAADDDDCDSNENEDALLQKQTTTTMTASLAALMNPADALELFSPEKAQEGHERRMAERLQASSCGGGGDKNSTTTTTTMSHGARIPLVSELVRSRHKDSVVCADPTDPQQFGQFYDWSRGRAMVAAAHRRGLKVWTWGDDNSDHLFAFAQGVHMGADGIITDNVPV